MAYYGFREYCNNRVIQEVVEGIVNGDISTEDVNNHFQYVKSLASRGSNESELYNELWGGLKGVGSSMLRGIGNAVGQGVQGVKNVAQGVGNVASNVAQGVGNVAQNIAGGAKKYGQDVKGAWNQGQALQGLSNLQKSTNNLYQGLVQLGYPQNSNTLKALTNLTKNLNQTVTAIKQNKQGIDLKKPLSGYNSPAANRYQQQQPQQQPQQQTQQDYS